MELGRRLGMIGEAAGELLLRARAGLGLMLRKGGAVALDVDGHAVLPRKLLGELDGEAEGIEEAERRFAVDMRVLGVALHALEFLGALGQGLLELHLLLVELGNDALAVVAKLGVDIAVGLDDGFRYL